MKNKSISVVVSAYNEDGNILPFYRAINAVISSLPQYDFEIIFVNDGSTDMTEISIVSLTKGDSRVRLLSLTRNCGHEMAMIAGMNLSKGDAVIFMDADLQHPPSKIPEMVALWESGNRIVLTKREGNEDSTAVYGFFSQMFYKVLNYLSDFEMKAHTPDFRLIDRYYIDELKQFGESSVLFRGLIYIIGAEEDTATIPFVAPSRQSGVSKYNYNSLINLAIDSILSFSVKPLRIALKVSTTIFVFSVMFGIYFFLEWLFVGNNVPGFMTLLLTVLLLGSANLFVLSVIGEYIGKIHMETKKRPLYTIKKVI